MIDINANKELLEGEEIPAELVDPPIIDPDGLIETPLTRAPKSQSPDGTWWELTVTNTGGTKWIKYNQNRR